MDSSCEKFAVLIRDVGVSLSSCDWKKSIGWYDIYFCIVYRTKVCTHLFSPAQYICFRPQFIQFVIIFSSTPCILYIDFTPTYSGNGYNNGKQLWSISRRLPGHALNSLPRKYASYMCTWPKIITSGFAL